MEAYKDSIQVGKKAKKEAVGESQIQYSHDKLSTSPARRVLHLPVGNHMSWNTPGTNTQYIRRKDIWLLKEDPNFVVVTAEESLHTVDGIMENEENAAALKKLTLLDSPPHQVYIGRQQEKEQFISEEREVYVSAATNKNEHEQKKKTKDMTQQCVASKERQQKRKADQAASTQKFACIPGRKDDTAWDKNLKHRQQCCLTPPPPPEPVPLVFTLQ